MGVRGLGWTFFFCQTQIPEPIKFYWVGLSFQSVIFTSNPNQTNPNMSGLVGFASYKEKLYFLKC